MKTKNNYLKQVFLSGIFIVVCISYTFSASILGGDITWSQTGKDSFLITLTLYRDCNGSSFSNPAVFTKCKTTGTNLDTIQFSSVNGVEITPVCASSCTRCDSSSCSFPYGFQKYVYQKLYVIKNAGSCCEILLSYSSCCRPSTITTGPASTNFYINAWFNRCLSKDDNSLTFFQNSPMLACIGQDLVINTGGYDIDIDSLNNSKDSIVFDWERPQTSQGSYVTYSGNYAYDKPIFFWGFPAANLPFPRGFHLDKNNGDISVRPMKVEITVFAIKVTEYRKINGNFTNIGELTREFPVIIIYCPNNNAPVLSGPFYKEICAGQEVTFSIATNDYDTKDTCRIYYNGTIPGASWSSNNGAVKHPTGTFKWTPDGSFSSTIPYNFSVSVYDDACPNPGKSTRAYQILVKPFPYPSKPDIDTIFQKCNRLVLDAKKSTNLKSYNWWVTDKVKNKTYTLSGDSVSLAISHIGKYQIQLQTANQYCNSYIKTDSILADTFLNIIPIADTNACIGTKNNFFAKYGGNKGKVNFFWNIGDSTQSIDYITTYNNTVLKVTANDSAGCTAEEDFKVSVFYKPLNPKLRDTSVCLGTKLNFETKFFPNFKYQWSNGDSSFKTTFLIDKAQTIELNLIDSVNCLVTGNAQIGVHPDNSIDLGKDKYLCFDANVTLSPVLPNLTNQDTIKYYHLTSGKLVSSGSKSVTIKDSGIYKALVHDHYGCRYYDTFHLYKNPPVKAFASNQLVCFKDTAIFSAQLTGTQTSNVNYEWFDYYSGKLLSTGNIFKTIANQNKYFRLKVSENFYSNTCTDISVVSLKRKFSYYRMKLPQSLCAYDSLFNLNLFGDTINGSFYAWHPAVQNGYLYNPSIFKNTGDSIRFKLVDSNTLCTNDTILVIKKNNVPNVDVFTYPGLEHTCPGVGQIPLLTNYGNGKWYGPVENGYYFNANRPEGKYKIIYEYENSFGCKGYDTLEIHLQNPYLFIERDTVVCLGDKHYVLANFGVSPRMEWYQSSSSDGYFELSSNKANNVYVPGFNDKITREFTLYAKTIDTYCPEIKDSVKVHIGAKPKSGFRVLVSSGNPPFKASFIDTSFITYDSISLYLWNFGDGSFSSLKNPQHYFIDTGRYDISLKVTSNYGCSDSVTKNKLIYVYAVSIPENIAYRIKVYPNPASNQVIIEASENKLEKVVLTNMIGAKIREFKLNNVSTITIERGKLPDGLYFLKVFDEEGKVNVFQVVFR